MFGYKCDKCGTPVYVDPGEERICEDCQEREAYLRSETVKIRYQGREKEACYAG